MRLPLTVCLPLSLALFSPTADDATWFAPETGLVLKKSVVGELRVALEDYTLSVNGEAQELELPSVDISVDIAQSWRDLYRQTAAGAPRDLEREYLEVLTAQTSDQGGEETVARRTSPLVGKKVRFAAAEEDGALVGAFVDDAGDEELLEDLRAAVDFLALLPEGEVAVGDTWNGDLARFDEVYAPLGELHMVNEDGSERLRDPWSELLESAVENMEGEFEITYTGNVEEGDRALAEFAVRIEAEGSGEREETRMRDTPAGEVETDLARLATLGVDLEGKLLWDLKAKHFVSFELGGSITITHEETESFEIGQRVVEFETGRVLAGTFEMRTEVETL